MSDIETNQLANEGRDPDRLQQLLCAYVLGECDASERAEVEKALAGDAALRAERDRLAATVGLVKHTLGKDETLSWQATSEVTRAAAQLHAGPPREVAWHRRTAFRAAASFVVLAGGAFLGWRSFVATTRVGSTVETAKAPAREGSPATAFTTLGYSGAPAGSASGEARPEDAAPKPDVVYAVRAGGQTAGASVIDLLSSAHGAEPDALAKRAPELKNQAPIGGIDDEAMLLSLPKAEVAAGDKWGDSSFKMRTEDLFARQAGGAPGAPPVGGVFLGQREQNPTLAAGEGALLALGYSGAVPAQTPPAEAKPGAVPAPGTGGVIGIGGGAGGGGGTAKYGARGTGPSSKKSEEKAKAAPADLGLGLYYDGTDGDLKAREPAADPATATIAGYVDLPALEEAEVELTERDRLDSAGQLTDFERLDRFADDARDDDSRKQRQRRILTPEERRLRAEHIVASCKRLPDERPRDMFFRFWGDNPFEWTATDRQSTFAMDVDTASYTLARRYLVENHLPEKAQIRTEEFVNYFKPDVAPPSSKAGGTFAIATELAPSRFSDPRDNKWLLRVAVRGMEIAQNERAPLALTLVVDVSGSMKEQNRLELVKHAMRMLVGQLDPRDSISIVAFSNDSRLILPMTSAGQRGLIESAIDPLQPDQGTNTESGLRMGYEQALAHLGKGTIHRVVLLTDGVANVGITDPDVLAQTVERQRKAGIYLNTIGVGMNNHNDHLLEQLADKGDGLCNYVDDAAEVKKVLVDDLLKTLVPIARDAKVQVEFDPAQVESYRLLGYENRAIADRDFRNDKVDAGEINSGHQITALYELVRTGNARPDAPLAPLAPLANVAVRFKPPHKDGVAQAASEEASEIASTVFAKDAAGGFEQTSYGYRRAALAAQFAEFLRRSVHARGDSLDQLIADVQKLAGERNDAETAELADMVVKSKALLDAEFARRGRIEQAVHDLRHSCFEQARLEARRLESDRAQLAVLEREIAEREANLRRLLDPPHVR